MVSKVTKDQEPIPYQALLDENNALKDEIQSLRARLEEPEELQRAIREGDLDALVMPVSEEDLVVFTLNGADQAYRTLMETANEDMVIVDDKFKVTYAGKRLLDKTGYSQEEVIGRPLMQFIDREYKTFVEQRMEERRKGVSDSYESKLISRDGSPYWAIVSAKPLFDNDGNFTGTLAMLTDITERKRAEEALQESEDRYHRLFDSMKEGFLLAELIRDDAGKPVDFCILEANLAYESVLGRKREEAIGRTLFEMFPRGTLPRAPIGLCMLDRELRYVRINERLAEINAFEPPPTAANVSATWCLIWQMWRNPRCPCTGNWGTAAQYRYLRASILTYRASRERRGPACKRGKVPAGVKELTGKRLNPGPEFAVYLAI